MNFNSSRRSFRPAGTKKGELPVNSKKMGATVHPKAPVKSGFTLKAKIRDPSAIDADGGKETRQSAADGLRAFRGAYKALEGQHHQRLNAELARVYAAAVLLTSDQDEWLKFCRDDDWETFPGKPKIDDHTDALRFAVRFAVGFPTEKTEKLAATKRASKYAGALRVLLDDKTDPDMVAKKLDELGIEELSKQAARRKKLPDLPTAWTLRFPEEQSAQLLASMPVGKYLMVRFRLEKVEGMLAEAIVRRIVSKPKKAAGS